MADSQRQSPHPGETERPGDVEVLVVGAGFSGLYMLHLVRKLGLPVRLIEAGAGVGGTWYWNRYPGARCDVESTDYQYGFDDDLVREWTWSERYASQPEILAYLNHVADTFGLRENIELETRVTRLLFDEETSRWTVSTDRGESFTAKHCVMATGVLSAARLPDVPGLERFEGDWYHTARWPHEGVDFTARRVAVVGTGSSAIQAIPLIAEQAAQLTVFQRTPNFSVPAHNRPRDPEDERRMKETFAENRRNARDSSMGVFASWVPNENSALEVDDAERQRTFEAGWNRGGFGFLNTFSDLVTNRKANELAAHFVHEKIREIVRDPELAERLCPTDHPFGTKRLCVDTSYYATYNRDNVTLVDLRRTPIEEITPRGLRTPDGEIALDAIVFATGFDAMTGAVLDIDIRGRGGLTLAEKWAAGPRTYLGIQTAGFPNLFLITGPGSPSVLSNMIVSIEQHVEWTADCIQYLHEHDLAGIEATHDAEDAWVEHSNERAARTLLPEADSWYTGANIPGKPRVFMVYTGGVGAFRRRCSEIADRGYEGFALRGSSGNPDRPPAVLTNMKVAVVGKGNVGGGLATLWRAAGHDVQEIGRDGGDVSDADVVLLAVPSAAIARALAAAKGVDGKVVIDATNHLQGDRPDFPSLSHQVQSITGGPVAKAFNLNFASIHDKASAEGTPPGSFYCADDAARDVTEQLIRDAGYSPVNAGALDSARALEDALPLVFAVSQGGGGPFFFRVGRPGEL